ncbi:hypothetical protein KM908_09805, partial [Alkalihalobacillus clausii]|uniref:hypothetical protein n=1 Tax=Shouchella clausii TaxID=79880 RepID=UPI001C21DBE2
MNKEEIKKYIDANLITKQEAMRITGQNIKGFDQTIASGNLKPFYDHGEGRSRVRLYHRDDVEAYARQAEKRRRETYKEIWTVVIDGHKRPVYSEDEARKMAEEASEYSDVYIEYYRA